MIKNKIYVLITALVLIFTIAVSSYAWLYNGDVISDITYSIAKIDSSVRLYKANDSNFNGVPDKLAATESAVYYMEQFSFAALGGEVFALSEQSAANQLVAVQLENVFPSRVYTLKYSLINRSTAENVITFRIGQDTLNEDSIAMLSTFSARLGTVSAADTTSVGTVTFGDKIYFADYVTGNTIADTSNGTPIDVVIPAAGGTVTIDAMIGQDKPSNHLDFWLQLEMEPYEVLAARNSFTMTETEYNALQGKTADLPNLYIYFEIVYNDQ
jgi:hypothetical protein